MGPIQSIDDLISMLRRRLPLVLTLVVLGGLVALYFAVTSPRVYESSAVIQIEAPAIVDAASDSGIPVARRVQLIEQRLMVRTNLLEMIKRHGLYAATPLSDNEKVDLLRRSARIESVAATGRDTGTASLAAIIITVQAETANQAADLANDFADSVINRDEENREQRIQETRQFLMGEETRVQADLDAHDRKVAEYNSAHEDSLPASQEFLQAEMTQLAEQDTLLDRDIMSLERERLAVQVAADLPVEGRANTSLAQQLRAAELELAQARRTFAADHPEIKRLEDSIRRLSQGGESDVSRMTQDQVALIDSQLQQLRSQKQLLVDRQNQIERARAMMPEVAREVDAMAREQRRLQDRYAETSRRLAEVEMLQSLQANNQTERFVVLERAVPPEYPSLSGRKKNAVLGGFVSIAMALGAAFLLELKNPVLRSAKQFQRATGVRPVIELDYVPNEADLDRAWRRNIYIGVIMFWALIGGVWLIGYLPGIPSPGVVGPMGSGK